jgi:hypothetical protein
VPKGVTTSVGPSGALPFPEHVSFVYDKGTYTSGAISVQIVTTFSLAPKTPSLNSQMSLTTWAGTTSLAQATVQGSMSRNTSL